MLLTSPDDRMRASKRFDNEFPPMEKIKSCYEALFNYLQIGIGDGKSASCAFKIHEFAAAQRIYAGTAVNALKILQQNGYLTLTDETDNPPRIMFTVGRDDLYTILVEREELDHMVLTLLRLYTGLFHDRLVPIDLQEIAHATGSDLVQVLEMLTRLWPSRIIRCVPVSRSPLL